MLTLIKTVQKSNHAKLQFTKLFTRHASTSQVTSDVRKANSNSLTGFDIINSNRGKFASKLPDFDLSPSDAAQNFEALALPTSLEVEGYSRVHPLEIAAKKQRATADIYS